MKNIPFAVFFIFLFIPTIALAGGNEKKQSFYKYPHSDVLPAGSFWNPVVTTKDGKKVSETYYKYPDSKTLQIVDFELLEVPADNTLPVLTHRSGS